MWINTSSFVPLDRDQRPDEIVPFQKYVRFYESYLKRTRIGMGPVAPRRDVYYIYLLEIGK